MARQMMFFPVAITLWLQVCLCLEIMRPFPETVEGGSELSLMCLGHEPEELGWTFNGMYLEDGDYVQITTEVDDMGYVMSTLSIPSTAAEDSGSYSCNDAGDYFNRDAASITVIAASLEFQPLSIEDDEIEVEEGSSFTLECSGSSDADVQWLHNGMPIPLPDAINQIVSTAINDQTLTSLLTVEGAVDQDSGVYTCSDISDYFNRDTIAVTVTAAEEIIVSITDPDDGMAVVDVGSSITFRCEGTGVSDIFWQFDHPDEEGITINTASIGERHVSLLTIDEVSEGHAGEYSCTDQDVNHPAIVQLIVN